MIDIIEWRKHYEIKLHEQLETFCKMYTKYSAKDPEAFPELMQYEDWTTSFEEEAD